MHQFIDLLIVAIFTLSMGCGNDPSRTEEYLIQVDSIAHPDTVGAGKSFPIAFFGMIGPNGCCRFLRFETERKANQLTIWTVGEKKTGQNLMCPEYLPLLDGTVLRVMAPDSGNLSISVTNPGLGNVLRSSVVIKHGH